MIDPLGNVPTRSPTPAKPSTSPTRRWPRTRSAWTKRKAKSAEPSGAVAWSTAAVPESIRVSAQKRR